MTGTVQALTNMEYMLYGNTPSFGNLAVPSMMNGYCASSALVNPYMMNPYYMGTQYNNPYYNQPSSVLQTSNTGAASNESIFNGSANTDMSALVDDYTKSLSPSESFMGAATGAAAFSVLFHPRVIAHPIKTYKSFGATKKIFDGIVPETGKKIFEGITQKGSKLAEGWASTETNGVLREAYAAMNRIDARNLKRKGLHIWRKPFQPGEYDELTDIMQKALKNFDKNDSKSVEELIKATETLNQANVKDGILPQIGNWFKNLFRAQKTDIPSAVAKSKTPEAAKAIEAAASSGKGVGKTYLQTLKSSSGGILGAGIMLAMEFLSSKDKISAAFSKDNKTGWTQVGQTTVKGVGSAIGWAAGDALGVWGCTKLLAAAGTAISPGLGTAVGAVAGMIVGSIGCWLTGKLTKKLVGQDVGDKIQAEQLASTSEGQVQLLQNTMQRMKKGEQVDPKAQRAVQNIMSQYSTAA